MTGRPAGRLTAILLAAAAWACDASPNPEALSREPPLHGVRLVVGSTLDRWSLLSVPHGGGVAETRSLADPTRVASTGTAALPATREAYALSDGLVVLRGSDGVAYTYDPASDVLVRVGEVDDNAAWMGAGSVGVFYASTGSVLEISREGVWRYGLEGQLVWAAPVDGGVLAVLEREAGDHTLWLLRRDEEQPAESAEIEVSVPGAVTAWGRRVVLTQPTGEGLVVLTTAPIERAGEIALEGTVVALTASPSSHELYVILDGPPRLAVVNRFNLSARTLVAFVRRPESVRTSLFGDALLVGDGSTVHVIPVGGTEVGRVSSEWRSDLPLGLPDGSVLVSSEEGVSIADPDSGISTALSDAGSDRWWLPVPWSPSTATVTTDQVAGDLVSTDAVGRPAREVDSSPGAPRIADSPGPRDVDRAPDDPSAVPSGFYAIIGSARQPEGMRALIASLTDAGFSTRLQSFPDEANRVWYRGLVGPYRTRSEAEAAARQLLRERRLEAWVTEIGASTRPEEPPA